MGQLQGSLLELATPRYRLTGKGELGVLSKKLLIFLIYREYQRRLNPSLAGIAKLRDLYRLAGLNHTNAKAAIQELEEHRLFRWADGGYELNDQGLVDVTGRYFGPADIDARKWCIAEAMCQYFFHPETRKRTLGRMDYLDKLLMLSLAVSVDEEARIKAFDFALWASWLGIDQARLIRRLNTLKSANGFVLDFSPGYVIGEGLHNPGVWLVLNPAHPWLHGDPASPWHRGSLDFYGYCLMEGKAMQVHAKFKDNETSILENETDKYGFTAFERYMDYEPYWQHLRDYIAALEAREQHEDKLKTKAVAEKVANQANASNSPEKEKGSENPAKGHTEPLAGVLPQWGKSIKQLKNRDAEYKRRIHRICFDLAQEVLRSISASTKTLTQDAAMAALASHPLFACRGFAEATERPEISAAMTQEMYLWLLYQGASYMVDTMVKVVMAALKAHPDKAVVDGDREARFIHFEVPTHKARSRKRSYSEEYRLSGVLFLRVFNTDYRSIFVQQTPNAPDLQLELDGSWFISHRGVFARINPYYKNSLAAGAALINDLCALSPSEVKNSRKSQEIFDKAPAGSWLEFLGQQSSRLPSL